MFNPHDDDHGLAGHGATTHGRGHVRCRNGCPHYHLKGPREHGCCCNACWRRLRWHTRNCTGYGSRITRASDHDGGALERAPWRQNVSRVGRAHGHGNAALQFPFRLPPTWQLCNIDALRSHLQWYLQRIGGTMPTGGWERWQILADRSLVCDKFRDLRVFCYAQDRVPDGVRALDVRNYGLGHYTEDGSARGYAIDHVSGVDWDVQANLLMQNATPAILLEALLQVEERNSVEFAFACRSGTHRSVGCAVLLVALVYSNAEIVLTTPRTCRDARKYGLLPGPFRVRRV